MLLIGFGLRRLRLSVSRRIDQRRRGDCYSGGKGDSGYFRSVHREFSIGYPALQYAGGRAKLPAGTAGGGLIR
jgi:hypothetical protein